MNESPFRLQSNETAGPRGRCRFVVAPPQPPPGSDQSLRRLALAGRRFREAGVTRIYLLHGTMAGADSMGVWGSLERWAPRLAAACGRTQKTVIDRVLRDRGNFSERYAQALERGISADLGGSPITVRRWVTSSENHHLGRLDGAVRLLDDLHRTCQAGAWPAGARICLWGHSHGGNVFAILTQLLAGGAEVREALFEAARPFYQSPISGRIDLPRWQRVYELLQAGDAGSPPLADLPLDIVTLGTPIRYGWRLRPGDRLLHFNHHHVYEDCPPHCAPYPPPADDLFEGKYGDFIQQLGIAGTNFPPTPLFWRAMLADRRLAKLMQPPGAAWLLRRHLHVGRMAADDGLTLLVDYGKPEQTHVLTNLAGHAVYTRMRWMAFQAWQTAAWLPHAADPDRAPPAVDEPPDAGSK